MAPKIALIGSEFEENLSLRYLAAAAAQDGLEPVLDPFNDADRADDVVRQVLAVDPRNYPAVDSIVRHEGELTLRDLCRRLVRGQTLAPLEGAVVRTPTALVDGGKRKLPPLDELPFPDRRGAPHEVMGIAAAPIVGSRGCYADCSFCCIYAWAENADGARYRRRSVESIVAEMRGEYLGRGVRLFIFHDDNFFVPSAEQNLKRYSRLRALLDDAGITDIALVIKCRPNDVTPELFALLKSMGLLRAYVGIETNSDEGIVSLNRRITSEDNRRALRILRELDVYHTFNVLIFDPEATLDGIERNIDFIEAFADIPSNFCRAEVYAGTPLKAILEQSGRLDGDYFAWTYQMRDPRVEVLFRIAMTAYAARNFRQDGVANLNMGIRGDNELMRRFYPSAWDAGWHERVVDYSRRVAFDSMDGLRRALSFVRHEDVRDAARANAFTAALARRVARADLAFVTECKSLRHELEDRIRERAGRDFGAVVAAELPPWAAETGRLGSSVGLEVSTELLPRPLALQ